MAEVSHEKPHPELDRWFSIANNQNWHPSAKPKVEGNLLLIPHAYFDWGADSWADEPKEIEWVPVRSREDLMKALGYGPVFD